VKDNVQVFYFVPFKQQYMSDNINTLLTCAAKSILIIEERENKKIVICAPHHAPAGKPTLPCPEHPDSDENTGSIARDIAIALNCRSIIACNYMIDPNKSLCTDYSVQIVKWQPDYLIEIHGHGAKTEKADGKTIEISSGKHNSELSEKFAVLLNLELSKHSSIKDFTCRGTYQNLLFKASGTATINDLRWKSFHIEIPPALRITNNADDIKKNTDFILALIEAIKSMCNNQQQ
jgi:hypothetical protein